MILLAIMLTDRPSNRSFFDYPVRRLDSQLALRHETE